MPELHVAGLLRLGQSNSHISQPRDASITGSADHTLHPPLEAAAYPSTTVYMEPISDAVAVPCVSFLIQYCRAYRPSIAVSWSSRRDDQLRELFDFMSEPNRGDSASSRVLCEVVDEWLKVQFHVCLYSGVGQHAHIAWPDRSQNPTSRGWV